MFLVDNGVRCCYPNHAAYTVALGRKSRLPSIKCRRGWASAPHFTLRLSGPSLLPPAERIVLVKIIRHFLIFYYLRVHRRAQHAHRGWVPAPHLLARRVPCCALPGRVHTFAISCSHAHGMHTAALSMPALQAETCARAGARPGGAVLGGGRECRAGRAGALGR